MTSRNRGATLGVAALAVCLTTAASAMSASAPLAYVTPAAMAAKIKGPVPQIPTDNTSPPSFLSAASCKGIPPAKKGKFNTFKCSASWTKGRATIWARALAGGAFCASGTGLAACPPPPTVVGDPRVCTYSGVPPTADPNRCALAATLLVVNRAMPVNFADPGWKIRNVSCTGSNLTRKCIFSSFSAYGTYYTSTISFKQSGGAWAATVGTTGGGGTSTCTVLAGPAGGSSRWQTGPTATCEATS